MLDGVHRPRAAEEGEEIFGSTAREVIGRREVIGERSVPALLEERSHADERVGSDGTDGRRIEEVLMSQMVEAFPSPHEAGH